MAVVLKPDGTITNEGGLLPDGLPLPEMAVADPGGAAPAAAPPAAEIVSAAGILGSVVIKPTFGASILNKVSSAADPTTALQIENAITSAINFFQTSFSSNNNPSIGQGVTINITFDYGFLNTTPLLAGGGTARSQGNAFVFNYATVQPVFAGLPLTDPTGGGSFFLPIGQMKYMGFYPAGTNTSPNSTEIDGYVGLNTIANGVTLAYDPLNQAVAGRIGAIGAIEHEIAEVLGRVAILGTQSLQQVNNGVTTSTPLFSILDMFRYTAPNTRALTGGTADYFSRDNGVTNLGVFNNPANGGDAGDWASSVPNDAFGAFLTTGNAGTISPLDIQSMLAIGLACFRGGTRIQTARGAVAVEDIVPGDELATLLGGTGRVIWTGRRAIDLTRHPNPSAAWPVRVRTGAFGPGLPVRDLYLSPDHAVYSDGVLIPVKELMNGATIAQVRVDHVVYHHVELERHDVILAEGLPAETYLDAGDRATFQNGKVTVLYPDFAARRWEMDGCAPVVHSGPELEAVRARLAARAGVPLRIAV